MAATGVVELLPVDFVRMRARRVVFTEHQLGAMSDTTFSPLGNHLTSLILGACAIKSLPARLLVDLTQLTALHLWSNHVRVIPSNFFVASAELRELSMWGNRLQAVHNRTFLGLPRLRLLDLDRNRISTPQRGSSDADTRWQYRSKLSSSSSSSVANASSARTVASLSSDRDQ